MSFGFPPGWAVFSVLAWAFSLPAWAASPASRADRPWTPDRVLVRWRAAPPAPGTFRFPILRTRPQANTSTLRVPVGATVEATLSALRSDPRVLYAGPNVRRRALALARPNEPVWGVKDPQPDYFTREYDTDVPEEYQQTYTWALERIQALEAWDVFPKQYYTAQTKPANPIKVAVLDTGCDLAHPEWVNAGGTSPDALHGGQLAMANAVSFLNDAGQPVPLTGDPVGHGTWTAGIVGAAANNGGAPGEGAVGLAYSVQVMPIQVLNSAEEGSVEDIIDGIYYAVDNGAQIISLSLGDYEYSPFEQDAIDYAWARGVLVVAAAGNDGTGNGGQNRLTYPAAANHVLAVGATDPEDGIATYSNTGSYVAVSAPGGDAMEAGVVLFDVLDVPTQFAVWSAFPTTSFELEDAGGVPGYIHQRYDYSPGTSASCPFVAGLAALYAQKNGITRATPNAAQRLYQAVQRGAENIRNVAGGGWNAGGGFGRINALNTLLDADTRNATVGCIVGKVTTNGNIDSGFRVSATNGTETRNALTRPADGGFRIPNLSAGRWTVNASTTQHSGVLVVDVKPGVDNFGADFAFPLPAAIVWGDADNSGRTDLADAVYALRMLTGKAALNTAAADRADIAPWAGVNGRPHGDGFFNADDARAILRRAGGLAP